jgi:hypothetical protein
VAAGVRFASGLDRADNKLNSDLRVGDLRDCRHRHPVACAVAQPLVDGLDDLGPRIVAAIGEPSARELLDVLTRSDADRAAPIGRLHHREDRAWLAELLIEIESEPDDIARLQMIGALRALTSTLGGVSRRFLHAG